jgi:hypothetical protein
MYLFIAYYLYIDRIPIIFTANLYAELIETYEIELYY